jgi:hypothetical protein
VGKNENSMGWMSKKVMEEKCLVRKRQIKHVEIWVG